MSTIKPFLFDIDFSEKAKEELPQTVDMDDHETALADARDVAYSEGRSAGEASASAKLAEEAKRVADVAGAILSAIDSERKTMEEQAARLALDVAFKLAPEAVASYPLADIEALVAKCLSPLRETPHLVIRLGAQDADALKTVIEPLIDQYGFKGRLVILGEDDIAQGDCRVEWADGAIIRNMNEARGDITKAIGSYFQDGLADDIPLPSEDTDIPATKTVSEVNE